MATETPNLQPDMQQSPTDPSTEQTAPNPTQPTQPRSNTAAYILLGLLVSGILLIGIVLLINLRNALNTPPAPQVPGVTLIEPAREVMDFTLPSTLGEAPGDDLSLSDLQGSYTAIFFGYTHCPDFCPLTLAEYRRIEQNLGELADDLNVLFVSVDPARDTPETLARYLRNFDEEFIGMSGDPVTLAQITPDYGLYYALRTDEGRGDNYLVDHSTASYLIDRDRQLRAIYSFSATPDDIAESIRQIIGAGA
ncbi:MAG: SCO family protein [Chloroflexi bacterium]|nr:SCO family protein [Chloroflexota bacterium]